MSQIESSEKNINKSLYISETVIADVVRNAALEVDGVKSIAKSKRSMSQILFKEPNIGDINIVLSGDVLTISLGIIIDNTLKAINTCEKVQEKVKSTVQGMLNMTVTKVDVRICDSIQCE